MPPDRTSTARSTQEESSKYPKPPNILACFRESPLVCINQDLVDQLSIIRQSRLLEYGSQHAKYISYATATSVIKGYPHKIKSKEQAETLPKIGEKIVIKVGEFLDFGYIPEARELAKSERFLALKAFNEVNGVGPTRAKELYNDGHRTLDDLKKTGLFNFKWHDDLQLKMPRSDVESIANFVRVQLEKIEPGAHLTLCGGYRRGKQQSNDVDIIITYPHEDGKERWVLAKLVERLKKKGLIPPDGVLTLVNAASERTTTHNNTRHRPHYRRVDLIVACWSSWGSAIVGWTGSTQFERDLRIHAHSLGYKFDAGGIRTLNTNQPVSAVTEEDVFRVLKVPWLLPHMRNADP
ncbi:Nucleotidyltransferase [Meredithblackwellia eburnea MCA 4105]